MGAMGTPACWELRGNSFLSHVHLYCSPPLVVLPTLSLLPLSLRGFLRVWPALRWNLPFQGLEGPPPMELQLLHECGPGQVSLGSLSSALYPLKSLGRVWWIVIPPLRAALGVPAAPLQFLSCLGLRPCPWGRWPCCVPSCRSLSSQMPGC